MRASKNGVLSRIRTLSAHVPTSLGSQLDKLAMDSLRTWSET